MASRKIGFIGVGMMGHGMARNLVEKGFETTILGHRNRQPVEDLVKRGAREAKDVAALVGASDIVFLCVTGSPQVEDLVYRNGGILESSRAGQMAMEAGIAGAMAPAVLNTLTNAVNLGFGTPEHLVGSLVESQAKLNDVDFPPRSR